MIQIKKATLSNFRAKSSLNISMGRRLTLLAGENGSGKTTLLDGLAIGLGAVFSRFPNVKGLGFKSEDLKKEAKQTAPFARIALESFDGLRWDRTLRRDQSRQTLGQIPEGIGLAHINHYIDEKFLNPYNAGTPFQLPVFSYYGVGRALLEVPLRRRGFPKNHSRFDALEGALNSVTRFKSAFIWFYNKEFEESKRQKEERSFDYKLPELEAVRKAIEQLFPDISEPHIMLNPLRFAVKINGTRLDIMQLSDGYKTMLSLVIDLASRMALANPHLADPLAANAVVMIDEIDLHLHPEWQRRVVGDLLRVFPNTQFILTSHSPYIIEAVNNHLMRFQVRNQLKPSSDLENLYSLQANDTAVYYLQKDGIVDIMDKELGLIDNKLIHPYNALAEAYDQMRDLQWEARTDD